jgi:hypothetical protein
MLRVKMIFGGKIFFEEGALALRLIDAGFKLLTVRYRASSAKYGVTNNGCSQDQIL